MRLTTSVRLLLVLLVEILPNASSAFHFEHGHVKDLNLIRRATDLRSPFHRPNSSPSSRWCGLQASTTSLETIATNLDSAFGACASELAKICKVKVAPSPATGRLGLVATQNINKGEVMLSMPYSEKIELNADVARNIVFKGVLADSYDGWTGDTGLIALLILNEVARASESVGGGIELPPREKEVQNLMASWVASFPSPEEMTQLHPLLWSEQEQEVLQSSSNTKVYRVLDDLEEDAQWLTENVFSKDREIFPEFTTWNGDSNFPCFSLDGYKWAIALAKSRTVFVDAKLRLLPFIDLCNHDDDGEEVRGGSMGTFGGVRGAQLVAATKYKAGEEVFCSYGPKSAVDFLLENGFCPPLCWKAAVSELTFEMDPQDRFYNDKLDILEFETYNDEPMDPSQSFDVVSAPGRDGEPDRAMIQFVRLAKLGSTDAFLLESIFRKEVWGFMALPVSERNELAVVNEVSEACQRALDELAVCPEGGPEVCTKLRVSETRALTRTLEYLQREKEALDLKEYYQERRLKDLGLDSEWTPEDEMSDPDIGFGQSRVPGGADYDW